MRVTTVLFDDGYEVLHDRIDIQGVAPITEMNTMSAAAPPCLDAIGNHRQDCQRPALHPAGISVGSGYFVITTDGLENASREYSYEKIKKLIEREKAGYQWEFIFLGANIDAIETAARFGISADRAANYHADGAGARLNYKVVSDGFVKCRGNPIPASWKAEIDEDFKQRGNKNN